MLKKLNALAISAAALCCLASMPASATFLTPGQSLSVNQVLPGHDGRFQAVMQPDGNFVVYRLVDAQAVWSTNTSGSGATTAVMQTDGNFVLYTADGRAVWNTQTSQTGPQQNQFTVDDDGTAVVLTYEPIWSTGTAVSGNPAGPALEFKYGDSFTPGLTYTGPNGYLWTFQSDGNLVLMRNGNVLWASNVTGVPYARFDGQLVGYSDTGPKYLSPIGQVGSNLGYQNGSLSLGPDFARFDIQSDGNAVIYQAFRVWGSNPGTPAPKGTFAQIEEYKTWAGSNLTAEQATANAVSAANLDCITYHARGVLYGIPISSVQTHISPASTSATVWARCQYLK